jgi:hypothetical protein
MGNTFQNERFLWQAEVLRESICLMQLPAFVGNMFERIQNEIDFRMVMCLPIIDKYYNQISSMVTPFDDTPKDYDTACLESLDRIASYEETTFFIIARRPCEKLDKAVGIIEAHKCPYKMIKEEDIDKEIEELLK